MVAVISVTPGRQILFVQQHATDPVNRLLDAWGLDKGAAARKTYARLGPASLESLGETLQAVETASRSNDQRPTSKPNGP